MIFLSVVFLGLLLSLFIINTLSVDIFFFVISIPTVVSSCYSITATCTEPEIISFTSYVSIFLLPCTRKCEITIFTHGLTPNNIAIILVDLVVTWSSNHKPPLLWFFTGAVCLLTPPLQYCWSLLFRSLLDIWKFRRVVVLLCLRH